MSMSAIPRPDEQSPSVPGSSDDDPQVGASDLLDLLGDEYTRKVLEVIAEEPRTAREVSEVASVSRPTAYRRLNDLQEAGLLTVDMVVDTDGHHRKRYEADLDRVVVQCKDGLMAEIVN
jgi:predicted transcriptional regulator